MALLEQQLAQQLAASGQLDPEIAAQLSGQPLVQQAPMSPMPIEQQQALDAQIAAQQPALQEQVSFDLSPAPATDYTSTPGALATQTPASPDVSEPFRAQAQQQAAIEQNLTPLVPEPTIEQTIAAEAAKVEPIQRQIAENQAQQKAVQLQAAHEQSLREKLEADLAAAQGKSEKQDQEAFGSLGDIMTKGGFGQKLGAAIAILLGGVSQGLTGAKSNPALDAIEKEIESQTKKKKLRTEQQEALRKALVDQYNRKLAEQKQATDDKKTKAEIEKLEAEGQKFTAEAQEKQNNANMMRQIASPGGAMDDQQKVEAMEMINPEQGNRMRQRLVNVPVRQKDGSMTLVPKIARIADGARVAKFENETRIPGEASLRALDEIDEFAKTFNKLDPNDRAKMNAMIVAATGNLRPVLLGPGTMQQKEYERLLTAIGDPNSFTTWYSREAGRRNAVRDLVRSNIGGQARAMGLDWAKSGAEIAFEALVKKGASREEAASAVARGRASGLIKD